VRNLIRALSEDFATTIGAPKGKWSKIDTSDLEKDPDLLDELWRMLDLSYAKIGGHAKYRSPKDLMKSGLVIYAVDVDSDPESDAFSISKKEPAGLKGSASGSDGTPEGKEAITRYTADKLKTRGYFSEQSGAIAHIMITRHSVPAVTDRSTVERVLEQKVKWIGKHPEGKYPGYDGWYERKIGDHSHMKIMLGLPLYTMPNKPLQAKVLRKLSVKRS
jgi:hypothetical protein